MPRSRPAARRPASRTSDRAILLRRTPFGETSLVVHVLTPEHGRVELMAKGAHRPRSRFFGVLDWFDTLELSWVQRKESDLGTLREGELLHRRRQLTRSLRSYRAAQTVVELVDLVTRAGFSDREQFTLAEGALDALDRAEGPPSALLAGFELKLLDQLGLAHEAGPAVICGQVDYISFQQVVCGHDLGCEFAGHIRRAPVSKQSGGLHVQQGGSRRRVSRSGLPCRASVPFERFRFG